MAIKYNFINNIVIIFIKSISSKSYKLPYKKYLVYFWSLTQKDANSQEEVSIRSSDSPLRGPTLPSFEEYVPLEGNPKIGCLLPPEN